MTENDLIKNDEKSNKTEETTTENRKNKIHRRFSNPFRWSRKYKMINKNNNNNNFNENVNDSLIKNNKNIIVQQNTNSTTITTTTVPTISTVMGVASAESRIESNNDKNINIENNKDISKEKLTSQQQYNNTNNQSNHHPKDNYFTNNNFANRIFRRSSFRKFLLRIAHHVSSIGANKYASQNNGNSGGGGGVGSSTGNILSSDRVPPIGGYQWPPDQTPGVTGLKNHGNTCFMNAVLQCLSHTDILAEYFVLDQYKVDLKRRNKINSKKFGTKGELTEQLANVLKALWTCKNETDHSTSFKAVVDRYGSQFRSSTQHDAQEFLFWLLDKVHEDLNTASKRRYKTVKNYYGRPDEIIAAETLANHIRCNNSFVQAVFQAQFRSSLTCPRCKKQSNTFDPFHCISVQLPQLAQQIIFVTVLYVKQHPKQVKLGLTVPAGSPIITLRERLNSDTGINTKRMVLADINETGFSRVFYDSQPISTLNGINTIYCIEIPEIKDNNSTDLMLLIANVKKTNDEGGNVERFGTPFCIQVNRDCSYVELQKKLLKEMSSIVKPEVFGYTTPLNEMFQIRLQDPSADPDTYLEQVEHPLFMEIIDMALSVLSSDAGPSHIKLLLEWNEPENFFIDLGDPVVEHESVSILKMKKINESSLTLEQCLEHYTKAEMLSAEDAWRCPNCQQYLPVVKTLGLWSLPDILVIHFKRFRQQHEKGPDSAKLTTMVKFPLNSFDMSPHLARTNGKNLTTSSATTNIDEHRNNNTFGGSPWRKSFNFRDNYHSHQNHYHQQQHKNKDKEQIVKDNRYDLYAVCYHQGDTLETGHYTAACKNPYDHQWYKFDDQRVSLVQSDNIQDEIVNNEAYILFYQRRNNDNTEYSASSSTTSTDHWISRIAPPQLPVQTTIQQSIPVQIPSSPIRNPNTNTITSNIPIPIEEKNIIEESPKCCGSTIVKSIKLKDNKQLEQKQDKLIAAVVIEKTDEKEEVDIESFEFADSDEIVVSANTRMNNKQNEILKIHEKENKSLSSSSSSLKNINNDDQIISSTNLPDIPKSIETNIICNNNNPIKMSDINNGDNNIITNNNSKLLNGHKENIINNDIIKIPNNNDKLLKENILSSDNVLTNYSGNTCIWPITTIIPNSKSPSSESISSQLSQRFSAGSSGGAFGGGTINLKDVLSTSLRSNNSGNGVGSYLDSSSSFGSNNCVNLRHSFSTNSNYKLKDCDTISLLRTNANTCSKDTLMYIDQQGHNLMDDDDSSSYLGSRSLWISPVTPHKLVTVSPKN